MIAQHIWGITAAVVFADEIGLLGMLPLEILEDDDVEFPRDKSLTREVEL